VGSLGLTLPALLQVQVPTALLVGEPRETRCRASRICSTRWSSIGRNRPNTTRSPCEMSIWPIWIAVGSRPSFPISVNGAPLLRESPKIR